MPWNRFGLAVFSVFADTRSKDDGTDKCCNTTDHMYCTGTCKIMEAHLADKPAAPDPVSGYRVNDQADQETVDTIGRKFSTFCHGSGYDRSGGCTEYCLEDQECPERNAVRKHCGTVICLCGNAADLSEESVSCSKHDPESDDPESRSTDTEIHKVFHDDVTSIFCSGEAGFYHCKSGLHKEDKRGAKKHPYSVY